MIYTHGAMVYFKAFFGIRLNRLKSGYSVAQPRLEPDAS